MGTGEPGLGALQARASLCGIDLLAPLLGHLPGCVQAPTNLQCQSLAGAQGSQGFQILHKEALHTREGLLSVGASTLVPAPSPRE